MNFQEWLDKHDGDALKALAALYEDRQGKIDSEGSSAQRARKQRDEAKAALEAAQDELTDARKAKVPDGVLILTGDDASAWTALTEKGGRDYLNGRLSRAEDADKLELTVAQTKAASAYGVGEDDLSEWLAGRPLKLGKAKDAEGKEQDAYGLELPDGFKPLSAFKTFTALSSTERKPEGKSFVPQTSDGKAPKVDPVADLNRRMFGTKKE